MAVETVVLRETTSIQIHFYDSHERGVPHRDASVFARKPVAGKGHHQFSRHDNLRICPLLHHAHKTGRLSTARQERLRRWRLGQVLADKGVENVKGPNRQVVEVQSVI
jgi:hypothetical protein